MPYRVRVRFDGATLTQPPSTMALILVHVADKYDLTVAELRGKRRVHRIAHPRQEAMWMMRQAGKSLPQIGAYLNRDHTTVLHGVRRHEARLAANRNPGAGTPGIVPERAYHQGETATW